MRTEYIFMNMVAPAFILAPLVTAFVFYRHLPRVARVLVVYLVFDMLVSIASSTLALYHLSNMPLYHIATMVDTVLLLYFFSMVMTGKSWHGYLKAAMLIFPLLALLNSFFLQPFFSFNSYTLSLKSILMIALSFLYWWYYEPITGTSWQAAPLNWIVSGLLIYFSSAFVLFTFSDFIISVSSRSVSILLWNIHAGLSMIMFLMLAIGFRKYKT